MIYQRIHQNQKHNTLKQPEGHREEGPQEDGDPKGKTPGNPGGNPKPKHVFPPSPLLLTLRPYPRASLKLKSLKEPPNTRVLLLSIARQLIEELSGDEEARSMLVEQLITHIVKDRRVRRLMLTAIVRDIATRDDVRREAEGVREELKKEIENTRGELKKEIDGVRNELKKEVEGVRNELKKEIESVKNELRKEIEDVRNELDSTRKELRKEIESVRGELKGEIDGLRKDILDIRDRVSRLEGQMALFVRLFIAFNVPILVGVIGTLLLLLWRAMVGAPVP
jgi:archaellum component FlaC